MRINLYNLQKETIEDYNRVVKLLQKADKDEESGIMTLDGYELERLMRNLHNDLAFVGSMIEKEGDTAYLNGDGPKMLSFHFDDDQE